MAHTGSKLVSLLRRILSFAFGIGLLLVDYLDGLIIIIILPLRRHLSRRAHGGRLVHHADLLLNFSTILSVLIFKTGLILHISLFILRIREGLLHLNLLLATGASRVRPLALAR